MFSKIVVAVIAFATFAAAVPVGYVYRVKHPFT